MEMIDPKTHLPDERIAEYAMGRLPKADVPGVFEHLLVCDECNERYENELTFAATVRAAAEAAEREPVRESSRNWLSGLFHIPKPAFAALAALALLVVFIPALRDTSGPAQTVQLQAFRGTESVTADADKPLMLRLDRTGLDAAGPFTVQIVNGRGTEVWRGSPNLESGEWTVAVARGFSAGQYWVRVSDAASKSATLLREFRLVLK